MLDLSERHHKDYDIPTHRTQVRGGVSDVEDMLQRRMVVHCIESTLELRGNRRRQIELQLARPPTKAAIASE